MYTSEHTAEQQSFLQLFHLAARCDCLYLLDFYCQHLFDHDQTSLLSDHQRGLLAEVAQDDIFAKAAEIGPLEGAANADGQPDGPVCFVKSLPVENVESGLAGTEEKFLFQLWRSDKGLIHSDSRLTRLSSKCILTLPEADPGKVPHVTFAGRQSVFRKIFPNAISNDKPVLANLPDHYLEAAAEAYHVAFAGEPSFDIQRTGPLLGPSVPDMTLQRLVLKFRTATGFERVFSLIKLLQIHSPPATQAKTALANLEPV
ncbi:hypothetical protein [Roseibium sp.]|uniref:hypothetical protein n=1 Tax=Roseibium sp. TaxID=1936156 RepID=UPI003B51D041